MSRGLCPALPALQSRLPPVRLQLSRPSPLPRPRPLPLRPPRWKPVASLPSPTSTSVPRFPAVLRRSPSPLPRTHTQAAKMPGHSCTQDPGLHLASSQSRGLQPESALPTCLSLPCPPPSVPLPPLSPPPLLPAWSPAPRPPSPLHQWCPVPPSPPSPTRTSTTRQPSRTPPSSPVSSTPLPLPSTLFPTPRSP